MEVGPDNRFPKKHEISWHDVTLELIQEKIDTDDLSAARTLARARLEGVLSAINDIEDELSKNESSVGPTSWQYEKAALEQDIIELKKILQTIDTDTCD